MLVAVGVIAGLAFIGWLIWQAAKRKPIRAHTILYGLSCLAGVFTFAFFLGMDLSKMFKILVSILLGAVLIFMAARLQRRREST